MNLDVLTLGERMVMIARIAAAEHIRQAAKGEGVEIARIGRLIQDAKLPVDTKPASSSMREAARRGPGEAA